MSLNLIDKFEITNYNTRHTQHTKLYFHKIVFFLFFKKQYFPQNRHLSESVFSAHLYGQTGNYLNKCFRHAFVKLLSDINPTVARHCKKAPKRA